MPRFGVHVRSEAPRFSRLRSLVRRRVAAALAAEGAPTGSEVNVLLVGDQEIAEYHERFMGISGPTDVLSWPSGFEGPEMGDVMVSCETAERQAAELGHSWEREVCVLAVHGTLHLMGWDDRTPEERDAMQARVDEIVDSLGPL